MNYRQWKKKYKKEHGYNPPLEHDRKKLNRIKAKIFSGTYAEQMAEILDTLGKAFRRLSEAFENIADRIIG